VLDGQSFEGAAYVFDNSGGSWTETAQLTASDGTVNDFYGWGFTGVAMQNGVVLAGAYNKTVGEDAQQGAAYFYSLDGAATSPTVVKGFAPDSVEENADSIATITLGNPNPGVATLSADLVDALPTGLVASATSTTCAGTASFTATTITLAAGATIPASGSCEISATVHATDRGSYVNTIAAGDLMTDVGANATAASATLIVTGNNPPSATVTPAALSFTVAADAIATDTLTIADAAGSDPLTFSITAQGPAGQPLVQKLHADRTRSKYNLPNLSGSRAPATFATGELRPAGNSSRPAIWTPLAPDGTLTFQLDDGSYENTIGFNNFQSGGNESFGAVWINRFAVTQALTVDSISILWPSTGNLTLGMQPILVAYYDADGDGDPANAVRLGSGDVVVTIDSFDNFQNYPVDFSVPGPGDVYIGFVDAWGLVPGGYEGVVYAASIDQDDPHGDSFVAASSTSSVVTDISNLGNNDVLGTIDSLGLPGNWLIRATATTSAADACSGPIVDWLSAAPAGGSVDGGASADITITANPAADSLSPGTYTAALCVATNDPGRAVIAVPVNMTVTPSAADSVFCSGFEDGESGSCSH
jgi:hypothetical protein